MALLKISSSDMRRIHRCTREVLLIAEKNGHKLFDESRGKHNIINPNVKLNISDILYYAKRGLEEAIRESQTDFIS